MHCCGLQFALEGWKMILSKKRSSMGQSEVTFEGTTSVPCVNLRINLAQSQLNVAVKGSDRL